MAIPTINQYVSFSPTTSIAMKNNITILVSYLGLIYTNSTQSSLFQNLNGSSLSFFVDFFHI